MSKQKFFKNNWERVKTQFNETALHKVQTKSFLYHSAFDSSKKY